MSNKEATIRPAAQEDIPSVDALWKEAAQYHGELDSRLMMRFEDTQAITKFHTKQLAADQSLFLVAISEEVVVGYVIARIVESPPHHHIQRVGVVDGMGVTSGFRGKGIGSALYERVLNWMLMNQIERLDTYVATKNPRAQAFWKRKGFVPRMHQISLDLTSK